MRLSIRILILVLLVSASTCAYPNIVDNEALLMIVSRYEQETRVSSARSKNKEIEEYLRKITCTIANYHCDKIRVYLLRQPGLNASMLPNGAMFIQTGLLLRVTSESELAFIIGHEIIHYIENHTLDKYKARKKSQQFTKLLSIGMQKNGVNFFKSSLFSTYLNLTLLGAYSRDAERESDEYGLKLSVDAGYDPRAASNIWKNFKNEQNASGYSGISLFSTHPPLDERMNSLKKNANQHNVTQTNHNNHLIGLVDKHRLEYINDEMRVIHPKQFEVLVSNQKLFFNISEGMENYLCAKAWKNYSNKKDLENETLNDAIENAVKCYEKAIRSEFEIPSSGFKEYAKLKEKQGKNCDAKMAYDKYLKMETDAWDSKYIKKRFKKINCPILETST